MSNPQLQDNDVTITVEIVGLPQTRSCIFYFNSREIGRIMGQDQDQEIEFPIRSLRCKEGPFNRPWYKEDIHVDIYDSEGVKKSSYKSLLSSKILSKAPQDPIKSVSSKIGEVHLPLMDALRNSSSLEEEGYSSDEKLVGGDNGNGNGTDWGDHYEGVGRRYRLVVGSTNGARVSSSTSKKKSNEDDDQFHETEAEYMLINLLYHNPDIDVRLSTTPRSSMGSKSNSTNDLKDLNNASTSTSSKGSGAGGSSSSHLFVKTKLEDTKKGREGVDILHSAEYVQHRRLLNLVKRHGVLMLRDVLPPSNPYFRHLYVNLEPPGSAGREEEEEKKRKRRETGTFANIHPERCIPLPGPSFGEKVLDCRDGVEWRVSAGVNIFGDPIYILCKGKLLVTDLRVIFVPFYLNSSFWPNGAAVVSHAGSGGYSPSVGIGINLDSPSDALPEHQSTVEVESQGLASLVRHTFQLYHSALFDCRCVPTPLLGFDSSYSASQNGGNNNMSSGSSGGPERDRSSSTVFGSGGGGGGDDTSVGAFLECCHEEYTNLMSCGNIGGKSLSSSSASASVNAPNGTSIHYMERLKNSYNLVFESSDGNVVEFTVPKLQKETRIVKRGSIHSKIKSFLRDSEARGGLASGDLSGDSDTSEDEDDMSGEDVTEVESSRDNGEMVSPPRSRAASIITSPRGRTSSAAEIRTKANEKWMERQYASGLATISITPQIWCHRVCDMCIWQARSDCSWILWAKYMKMSVELSLVDDKCSPRTASVPSSSSPSSSVVDRAWLHRVRQPLSADTDYQRMRVMEAGWRMYDGNSSYEESPTYPKYLYVPEEVDDELVYAVQSQRSKRRIQALVWLHPSNKTPMVRCAQPLAGMNYSKLESDIQMMQSIKRCSLSYLFADPSIKKSQSSSSSYSSQSLLGTLSSTVSSGIGMVTGSSAAAAVEGGRCLRIADARPKINANANALKGGGTENVSSLGTGVATLNFLDIENIHTMRSSITRLKLGLMHTSWGWTGGRGQAISYSGSSGSGSSGNSSSYSNYFTSSASVSTAEDDGEDTGGGAGGDAIILVNEPKKMDIDVMSQSSWKVHLTFLLKGAIGIAESLAIGHPVSVHCSDGWDRTAQLSSLSQVLMDPYYRTIDGFLMLIQKEWCAFGHKFEDRIKVVVNANARTNTVDYLLHVQASSANIVDYLQSAEKEAAKSPSVNQPPPKVGTEYLGSLSGESSKHIPGTRSRELSPVFLQFLDCVWQVHRQYPSYFEFSTHFLVSIAHACQSGLFSTFRENNEKCRFALMQHQRVNEGMKCDPKKREDDLHFSHLSIYIAIVLRTSGGDRSLYINALYIPPRARDRKFLYLRPRCTGPHDLELWRYGLGGFVDPYVGTLSDPTTYVYSREEREQGHRQHQKHESNGSTSVHSSVQSQREQQHLRSAELHFFTRDIIENLVEDVLDRCTRTFYSEAKHMNRLLLERLSNNNSATGAIGNRNRVDSTNSGERGRQDSNSSLGGSPMSQGSSSSNVGFPLSPENSPRATTGTVTRNGNSEAATNFFSSASAEGAEVKEDLDSAVLRSTDDNSGNGVFPVEGTGTGMSLDDIKRKAKEYRASGAGGAGVAPAKKSSWW